MIELMKRIPPVPLKTIPKPNKLTNRTAPCNLKVYDGKFDPIDLKEGIRKMEKIFIVVEVFEEKKVNIGTFYSISEVEIWWSTAMDKLQGPKHTYAKFLEELRPKFYPITV